VGAAVGTLSVAAALLAIQPWLLPLSLVAALPVLTGTVAVLLWLALSGRLSLAEAELFTLQAAAYLDPEPAPSPQPTTYDHQHG
jgi:hypothetical protein